MKTCKLCQTEFDPKTAARITPDPAIEAGIFLAQELYDDVDEVCLQCLANRGTLGMMYCREYT